MGLVLAMWEHASSRAKDPDLHVHVQIFNVGVDKDGNTRTIDSTPIFQNQKLFTAYYRAKLAAALRAEFGIEFEVDRKGLRMCGIPRELVRQYSKRRQAIVDRLAEQGESGAAAAARAALTTRGKKDPLVSRQELFRQWQATNAEAGFDDNYIAGLLRHGPRQPKGDCREVIQEAIQNLTRQTNHFSRHELVIEVLTLVPKYGLPPDLVLHATDTYLSDDTEIVCLGVHEGERRFTVRSILDAEDRLLCDMDLLAGRPGNVLYAWEVERELKKYPTLSPEQVALVRHLTMTDSAVRIGLGLAGTGKTHAVRVCVNAWKRKGYRVLVAAPTGQAARILGQSTGADGETLTKVLGDFRLPPSTMIKHAKQLFRTLRRRRTWRLHQPIRDNPRAMPSADSQPQPRILPTFKPMHARLGTTKAAVGGIGDLIEDVYGLYKLTFDSGDSGFSRVTDSWRIRQPARNRNGGCEGYWRSRLLGKCRRSDPAAIN